MRKEDGKDVYILGDSDTTITPLEILDEAGNLDYIAIAFSNNAVMYKKGDVAIIDDSDLIIGFRSEGSIDHLIEKLMAIKSGE